MKRLFAVIIVLIIQINNLAFWLNFYEESKNNFQHSKQPIERVTIASHDCCEKEEIQIPTTKKEESNNGLKICCVDDYLWFWTINEPLKASFYKIKNYNSIDHILINKKVDDSDININSPPDKLVWKKFLWYTYLIWITLSLN